MTTVRHLKVSSKLCDRKLLIRPRALSLAFIVTAKTYHRCGGEGGGGLLTANCYIHGEARSQYYRIFLHLTDERYRFHIPEKRYPFHTPALKQ